MAAEHILRLIQAELAQAEGYVVRLRRAHDALSDESPKKTVQVVRKKERKKHRHLKRDEQYGRVLAEVAKADGSVTSAHIAKTLNISGSHAALLLKELGERGDVETIAQYGSTKHWVIRTESSAAKREPTDAINGVPPEELLDVLRASENDRQEVEERAIS
jgi:ribosomal protein S25